MSKADKVTWFGMILIIGLMQSHSIPFWQSIAGLVLGVLWSISSEYIALWLWYHRKDLLAFFASLIVIIGPLGGLALPVLQSIQEAEATKQHLAIYETDAKRSIIAADSMLQDKWAGRHQKEDAKLTTIRSSQHKAIDQTAKQRPLWLNISIIIFEASALIIAWLTLIFKIRSLAVSKQKPKPETDPETKTTPISDVSETTETISKQPTEKESFAETLISRFERFSTEHNITQGQACNELGISSSDISKTRNILRTKGEKATAETMSKVNNQLKEKGY